MNSDGEQRSWLTRLLLDDPRILRNAAELVAREGGSQDAYLAARRMLDAHLREASGWPRGADYGRVAHELGDEGHARLLWAVAGTDVQLQQARSAWAGRYETRADTVREIHARKLCDDDRLHYSEDGVLRGVDGARYAPGYISEGPARGFAVVVYSRGMQEIVTGFADHDEQRRWVADRGPTATGELILPGMTPAPRVVLEERMLATLLARPWTFAGTVPSLPADTFTADGRYEIFAAMTTLAKGGREWYGWQVPDELDRRTRWLPDEALREFGGAGAPWLQAYVRRLNQTPVSIQDGHAAAREIIAEDGHTPQVPGWYRLMAERKAAVPAAEPRETPDSGRQPRRRAGDAGESRPLVPRPPQAPSGPDGPQPHM